MPDGHDQEREPPRDGASRARPRSWRGRSRARRRSSTAAASARPIPIPSDAILRLTSSAASSSSRRTSELACSATLFTVDAEAAAVRAQSLGCAWPLQSTTLASTIPTTRAAPTMSNGAGPLPALLALLLLRPGREPSCGPDGARRRLRFVGASPLARAPDQARLQLAQEGRVVAQLVGEPFARRRRLRAATRSARSLQLVGVAVDQRVALVHFFTGGASPWRRARARTRPAARPWSRPRRYPRRDRSTAASAACRDRYLTMTRPNLALLYSGGEAPA